jgi:hypothetical protein
MDFAGNEVELEVSEVGGILLFRTMPRKRWIDVLLYGFFVAFFVYFIRTRVPWYWSVGIGGSISWSIYKWIKAAPQELWVSDRDVIASDKVTIPWNEIVGIDYRQGDEDNPSGLYARQRWGSICLLPRLDEDQTARVIEAIYSRFKNLTLAEEGESFSLFGKRDELISLGLSAPKD